MELSFRIRQEGCKAKRKNPGSACQSCRQRKTKCHHGQEHAQNRKERKFVQYSPTPPMPNHQAISIPTSHSSPSISSCTFSSDNSSEINSNGNDFSSIAKTPQEFSRPHNPPTGRFIGNLNPVAFLVGEDGNNKSKQRAVGQNDFGVWIHKEEVLSNEVQAHNHQSSSGVLNQTGSWQKESQLPASPLLPIEENQRALIDIYFQRVCPMLPIVQEDGFRAQFEQGAASPYLLQAICLVAAKDSCANPFFCFRSGDSPLPFHIFVKRLYDDISRRLTIKAEKDKVTLIQTLALLSLHTSDYESSEMASMYHGQSIHHAHTIGLHLSKVGLDQEERALATLFWCLWSLDRWNAAINGRPPAVHDYDLGQRLEQVIHYFDPPFRVWLLLTFELGKAMEMYRPSRNAPTDDTAYEIPSFEEILDQGKGFHLPVCLTVTLEMTHNAVALIASRLWGPKDKLPPHTTRSRQDLILYRMSTLIQIFDVEGFLPISVVPYAMSLGFSISYSSFKSCQLVSRQHSAKRHAYIFYNCLKSLGAKWFLAQEMMRLGQRAMEQINQATKADLQQNTALMLPNTNLSKVGSCIDSRTCSAQSYSHDVSGAGQVWRTGQDDDFDCYPVPPDNSQNAEMYQSSSNNMASPGTYFSIEDMNLSPWPPTQIMESIDGSWAELLESRTPF